MEENPTLNRLRNDIPISCDISQYQKRKNIGKDSVSDYFLSNNPQNGRNVVLRIYNEKNPTEIFIKQFSLEVRCLYQNKNPFIAGIIGYSVLQPLFIVLDLNNMDFLDIRMSNDKIDLTQKYIITLCLSYALYTIHSNGFISRSIRPQSIVLNDTNLPIIFDFAYVRYPSNSKRNIKGSEELFSDYLSPEYIDGEIYNEKLDVYSFGLLVLGFFLEPESRNDTIKGISSAILQGKNPKAFNNIPEPLSSLIRNCILKDPSKRYSISKILDALQKNSGDQYDMNRINEAMNTIKTHYNRFMKKQIRECLASPKGIESLKNIIEESAFDLSGLFFQTTYSLFNSKVSIDLVIPIIDLLLELIKNKDGCTSFVNKSLIYQLPFNNNDVFEKCMEVLYWVFTHCSMIIDEKLVPLFKFVIKKDPIKSLTLFSIYISNTSPKMEYIDTVLKSWKVFASLNGDTGKKYISLLYNVVNKYENVKKDRIDTFLFIFDKMMRSDCLDTSFSSLLALSNLSGEKLVLENSIVRRLISNETYGSSLVSIILRSSQLELKKDQISKDILDFLILFSQKSNKANFLLCLIADSPLGAELLIQDTRFLTLPLPSYSDTLRIFLVLNRNKNYRRDFASNKHFLFMFYQICEHKGTVSVHDLSKTLLSFDITPEILELWNSSSIIHQFINISHHLNDEKSVYYCLNTCFKLANTLYFDVFCDLIRFCFGYYNQFESCKRSSIRLFMLLSKYKECCQVMISLKIPELIKNDIQSEYSQASLIFYQNISNLIS